jgi:hypothetical protein
MLDRMDAGEEVPEEEMYAAACQQFVDRVEERHRQRNNNNMRVNRANKVNMNKHHQSTFLLLPNQTLTLLQPKLIQILIHKMMNTVIPMERGALQALESKELQRTTMEY